MQGSETDNPSKQERIRQDYLQAMGIQTWFPRCQLPNALPPRPFDWITEDAVDWEQAQRQTSNETLTSQRSSEKINTDFSRPRASDILGQAHIDDEPEGIVSVEKTAAKAETPKSLQGLPATSKFRLVVQAVNEDCLVIAEMPHSGLDQFTRFHQRLLNNILLALNITPDQASVTSGEFVWPLAQRRGLLAQINQDDLSAAEAVCAFLSNQYGFARRKTVLMLGQAAARFVIDPEKKFEDLRGIQLGTSAGQHYAVTHSLNELMKLPQHKQEAWQDLAPLLQINPAKSATISE